MDNKKANEKWRNEKEEIDRFIEEEIRKIHEDIKQIEKEQAEFEKRWRKARG